MPLELHEVPEAKNENDHILWSPIGRQNQSHGHHSVSETVATQEKPPKLRTEAALYNVKPQKQSFKLCDF